MKKHVLLATVAILAFGPVNRTRAQDTYVAILTGGQQVPPVNTQAVSLAYFLFVGNAALIGFRYNFNHDQTVTDVHIHEGGLGVNGNIILDLRPGGFCIDLLGGFLTYYIALPTQLSGGVTTMDELKSKMNSGDTYLNLHTVLEPGGWIRGQVFPLPTPQQTSQSEDHGDRLPARLLEIGARLQSRALEVWKSLFEGAPPYMALIREAYRRLRPTR